MDQNTNIKIFVVDDHQLFADGLIELLGTESDFEIVGQAPTVAEARQKIPNTLADIILMDVHLSDGNGLSIHRWINENIQIDTPKILYVTGDDNLMSITRAMSLGAMAYLDKTGGWEEVANAIRRAHSGIKTLGTNITEKLAENPIDLDIQEQALSVRETEILNKISAGLTAKEMSAEMDLALPTVRTYVSRLFKKLGAKDRAHAVSIGYARGLIDSRL